MIRALVEVGKNLGNVAGDKSYTVDRRYTSNIEFFSVVNLYALSIYNKQFLSKRNIMIRRCNPLIS